MDKLENGFTMQLNERTKLMYSLRTDIYEYRLKEKIKLILTILLIVVILIIGIFALIYMPVYTFHFKLPVFDKYWFIFGMAFLMFIGGLRTLFKKD